MKNCKLGLVVAIMTVGVAGCTREVIIPADQMAHEDRAFSPRAVAQPGGRSVCSRIDPATGTCPAGAWTAVSE